MSKPDNPPFFPTFVQAGALAQSEGGATLRDWFAGQALAAIADHDSNPESLAIRAHAIAAAMIAERPKWDAP